MIKVLYEGQIEQKKSLSSTVLYLSTKIHTIFRFSQNLLEMVNSILRDASSVSVSRSYYSLLTNFASYLCQAELYD